MLDLDYRTGNDKVCLIDNDGEVLGYDFVEYPLGHERLDWLEYDLQCY